MMREIFLAKYGEIALKGLNKGSFEATLMKTLCRRLARAGDFKVRRAQSTVFIEPCGECDMALAELLLKTTFGISALERAAVAEKDFGSICEVAEEYLSNRLSAVSTFKVEAKRSDKSFPMNSMEISAALGGYLLERHPKLTAEMKSPELTVHAEVRDFGAYIHSGNIGAAGGMPVGTGGRAIVMLSGGIDSPVAAYMLAKRGIEPVAVHFQSPPYTSERALSKVYALASRISLYCDRFPMFAVPFTDIQLKLRDSCPEQLFTILMRRSMMRVSNRICEKESAGAIITGESLGQVASQTLDAIRCTDAAAEYPVFRPLIGMDKSEIIAISREIGTFETSILPYEDCCTVFTPKHPKLTPKIEELLEAESLAQLEPLEIAAAENAEFKMFHFYDEINGGSNEG